MFADYSVKSFANIVYYIVIQSVSSKISQQKNALISAIRSNSTILRECSL